MKRVIGAVLALSLTLAPAAAGAWGTTGHRIIGEVAMQSLPDDVPAFLTSPGAVATISQLGTEMDRVKGAGYSFDHDMDPAHYVDVGDDRRVAGNVALSALPNDMEAYANALRQGNGNPYKSGYLPYAIADGWQVLRKDFAYWRAFDYLSRNGLSAHDRDAFANERVLREQIIIYQLGIWAHFVGDGSQPLHVTVHYNDRGIHAPFEGAFVRAHVTAAAVKKLVPPGGPRPPQKEVDQHELLQEIGLYLRASNDEVPQLYAIARRGGFTHATPEATAFAVARVADGARELRDLVVLAWDDSIHESVGYPAIRVNDILSGSVHPTPADFGDD
ncbi:MAG TPA: hypothetical protein VFE36_08135 [Candidatus Baltobacteraceae bacterium]|jgi:hypothetical protein|nr:hypothetical protein [Candidatus Baltobacteraceae bacterium]